MRRATAFLSTILKSIAFNFTAATLSKNSKTAPPNLPTCHWAPYIQSIAFLLFLRDLLSLDSCFQSSTQLRKNQQTVIRSQPTPHLKCTAFHRNMSPDSSHPQDQVQHHSLTQPDSFWAEQASHLHWHKPPTKTLSRTEKVLKDGTSHEHWEWFEDGEISTWYALACPVHNKLELIVNLPAITAWIDMSLLGTGTMSR